MEVDITISIPVLILLDCFAPGWFHNKMKVADSSGRNGLKNRKTSARTDLAVIWRLLLYLKHDNTKLTRTAANRQEP